MTKLRKLWRRPLFRSIVLYGFLLPILIPALLVMNRYFVNYAQRSVTRQVSLNLESDQAELKSHLYGLENNEALAESLSENDTATVQSILSEQNVLYNQRLLLGVTNSQGIVLSRLKKPRQSGDNVYVTTTIGRAISNGEQLTSYEIAGTGQFVLAAGTPIYKDMQNVGGVVLGYGLNDSYVTKLSEQLARSDIGVAFYTPTLGITGMSFTESDKRQAMNSFFAPKTVIDTQNLIKQPIRLDGSSYLMSLLPVSDDAGQIGYVVVLYPFQDHQQAIMMALLLTAGFLWITLILHQLGSIREVPEAIFYRRTAVVSFAIFLAGYIALNWLGTTTSINLKTLGFPIYNSTMSFAPASSILDSSENQTVSIQVHTGGEAINAVEAVVNYDPKSVTVKSIDADDSFCGQQFFIKKTIDNVVGKVDIACGLPTPGYAGDGGTIAKLVLVPNSTASSFTLKFDSRTQVLANDGLGTDVLRSTTNSQYELVNFQTNSSAASSQPPAPPPPPLPTTSAPTSATPPPPPDGPVVDLMLYSTTDSNQEQWYSSRKITATWNNEAGFEYGYLLDQTANTDATLDQKTTTDSYGSTVASDGIWYLHVRPFKNGMAAGATKTWKFMIDSTPPQTPTIQLSATQVSPNQPIRLKLSSQDQMSGLGLNYYLRLDSGLLLPSLNHAEIVFPNSGTHTISVRVFDAAGNTSDSTVTVAVGQVSLASQLHSLVVWLRSLFF